MTVKTDPRTNTLSDVVAAWLLKEYGFMPDPAKLAVACRLALRKLDVEDDTTAVDNRRFGLMTMYRRWFRRQGFADRRLNRHSAAGFARWLDDNYLFIPVRKFWRVWR